MKIYLAGKISQDDWRGLILPDLNPGGLATWNWESLRRDGWPVDIGTIFGGHDYVGPWFMCGSGHGLSHGANTHGTGDNGGGDHRADVIDLCRRAIASADLVFVWIDSLDAFGTIAEIGYSAAAGVPVAIGYPIGFDASDLWFIDGLARVVVRAHDPRLALGSAMDALRDSERLAEVAKLCGSPIERMFLDAFLAVGFRLNGPGVAGTATRGSVVLHQQHHVGPYRLDFALVSRLVPDVRIAIEADGHDFHERTKAQAQRDKSRDRFLVAEGWRVLRFTGSEVFRDAAACVAEVMRVVESLGRGSPGAPS